MIDDAQLLSDYRANGSEKAFGELVSRYVDLVYSAALRLVGRDHQLAEDVSQKVFSALAQKGRELPPNVILGGWLYRHTFFVASQTVREERRRRLREEQAAFMNADNSEADWETLAPALEEAMQRLDSRDRDALILRYFKGRDLRAVGAALGTSEDAARMRINRALDKLRGHFEKKDIHVSAAILATLLGAHAVSAAPVGLAATITSAALSAASVAGTSAGIAKMLFMKKLALGLLGTASVAGITASLVTAHQLDQSRQENARLHGEIQQLQSARAQSTNVETVSPEELERLRKQESELLRLRGEVGLLRDQVKKAGSAASGASDVEHVRATKAEMTIGVTDTVVTGGMETHPGEHTCSFITPHAENEEASRVTFQGTIVEAPDTVWKEIGIDPKNTENVLGTQIAETMLKTLQENPGVQILSRPRISTAEGVDATLFVGDADGANSQTLAVSYHTAPDHKLVLTLVSKINSRETGATGQ